MRRYPSLAVASVALAAALCGTAVAAGEIITRPDQVAADVIDSRHVRPGAITRADLDHPALRVRVSREGEVIGSGDATARRLTVGRYQIRFRDPSGSKAPVPLDDCAITATPATLVAPALGVTRSGVGEIIVWSSRTTNVNASGAVSSRSEDVAFDVIAVC